MQPSRPTLAFKPLISFPYLLPLHPHHGLMLLVVSTSFSPLTPSGFFNEMMRVSEPEELKYYTLSRLIPLTLFVSRVLTLIYLVRFGSPDSLLCDLIATTPGLAFFLLMPRTLSAASSFLSGNAHSSLNFQLPLFLRLTLTLIMQRSTSF